MREIWIPLALVTLFLFLHIIRRYIKKLRVIDGLAWLPLLALLSTLAIFPAYGFRPEIIPLLLYSLVLTVIVIFKQLNGDIKFRSFRNGRPGFVIFPLILLAAAAVTAFYFTPKKALSPVIGGVYTVSENDYAIRIYTDENDRMPSRRPLLIILPPELGSLAVVDEISGELRDCGFTVLACARNSGINPAKTFRYFNAFVSGNTSVRANESGRALEDERKKDAGFILSWIRRNPNIEGAGRLFDIASKDAVYAAGYDTGASALILPGALFSAGDIKVQGLIVIECPLWSLYRGEENMMQDLPANAGWFQSVKHGVMRWLFDIKPKKIIGLTSVPELSAPVLFLVSDRSREIPASRYEALFKCFASAQAPAVLASADGAGPLDYSGFPSCYPIVTAVLKGRGGTGRSAFREPPPAGAIIAWFAGSVFAAGNEDKWPLRKTALPAGVHIQVNGK